MAPTTEPQPDTIEITGHRVPAIPRADNLRDTLAILEAGIARLTSTPAWTRWLRAQAMFHEYSFNNVMLIEGQRPQSTRVAGFTTWKRLGRSVRRGERGIKILAPIILRHQHDARVAKEATPEDGRERGTAIAFRVVHVFAEDQTEGDDIPTVPSRPLTGGASAGVQVQLEAIIRSHGFSVAQGDLGTGRNGVTDFGRRTVTLDRRLSPAMAQKTMSHELAHVVLHDPTTGAGVIAGCRGQAELEAESVAFIVMAALGCDSSDYSLAYVAAWAGGGTEALTALRHSADRISRTAREIIEKLTITGEVAA